MFLFVLFALGCVVGLRISSGYRFPVAYWLLCGCSVCAAGKFHHCDTPMPKKRGRKRARTARSSTRATRSSTTRASRSSTTGRGTSTRSSTRSTTAARTGAGRGRGTSTNTSSQDQPQDSSSNIPDDQSQISTQQPIQLSPFELQQIFDQRSAQGSANSPVTSPQPPGVQISPHQLRQMNELQLRQLLVQISARLPPTNPTNPQTRPLWTRPHVSTSQDTSQLPESQTELIRNRQVTQEANSFLQQAGISQNLQTRAPETPHTMDQSRPQYPAPAFSLPPAPAPVISTSQQILNLLEITALQARQSSVRRHDRAIQLSDYISPTATFEEDRLMASPDGTIKMGKPSLKFYDVPSWGSMALTSARDFSKLHSLKDPRIVKFNLLEYLFYLQTMFVKFKRYNFKQVLQFDRAYRTLQLREGFVWGTHIPELFECHLSGHTKPLVTRKSKLPKKIWQQPKTCHTFNRGVPCSYSPCSYLHQCTKCGKAHPAINCPTVTGSPTSS